MTFQRKGWVSEREDGSDAQIITSGGTNFSRVVWREKREASCDKACLASIIIDRTRAANYQRAKVIR